MFVPPRLSFGYTDIHHQSTVRVRLTLRLKGFLEINLEIAARIQTNQRAVAQSRVQLFDTQATARQRVTAVAERSETVVVRVIPAFRGVGELLPVAIGGLQMLRPHEQSLVPMNGWMDHATGSLAHGKGFWAEAHGRARHSLSPSTDEDDPVCRLARETIRNGAQAR